MLLLLSMQPSRPNQSHPRKTATSSRLPVDGCIRTSRRIRKAKEPDDGEDVGTAARARVRDKAVRKSLNGKMAPVSDAMARQAEALEAAEEVLGRAGMRGRLAKHLNPKRQQAPAQERRQGGPRPF